MTTTGLWGLIPIKRLDQAKQRLAPILDASERSGIARAMALDVLAAAAGAKGLAGIAVITADPGVARLARRRGLRVIDDETEAGTRAAVEAGARMLADEGASGLLVLPADLPLATPRDIEALVSSHAAAPAVTIVAASSDGGSNALACSPIGIIRFHFGADSFARHCAAARERGLKPGHPALPRLARDIDRPGDLIAFMARPSQTESYAFLAGLTGARWRFAADPSMADPSVAVAGQVNV